jgi:GDPmannose 4,6-dehydratase
VKTALITGLNSQDGSYLAEFLLKNDYSVIGTIRGKNPKWPYGFNPVQDNLEVVQMDLGHPESIRRVLIDSEEIDEVYNLAAQSHVGMSFSSPEETYRVTGVGACILMDEYFSFNSGGKFYQASTSEMIGNRKSMLEGYQPESPYAVAKTMAHYNAMRHLGAGRFVVSALLFNHESERRHESFVTQKIAKAAVEAWRWEHSLYPHISTKPTLRLGNIESYRDWGYAPEYVEIMWKMMQQGPSVGMRIGTGISISVREYLQKTFALLGLDWKNFTYFDSDLVRPQDVDFLRADPALANNLLGRPLTDVYELISILVEHQCVMQDVKPVYTPEK